MLSKSEKWAWWIVVEGVAIALLLRGGVAETTLDTDNFETGLDGWIDKSDSWAQVKLEDLRVKYPTLPDPATKFNDTSTDPKVK